MKIEHIAIWAKDVDALCGFYARYFGATVSAKYHNPRRGFTSCFLSFSDGGTRIEVMNIPELKPLASCENVTGLAHFAVSVGSREAVDLLTGRLRADGFRIMGEPRTTGDGYYESTVFDPEGNLIEISV